MRKMVGFRTLHEQIGLGRKPETFRVFLWRQVKAGRLPAPIKIGAHAVAWYEDEVEAAIEALRSNQAA